MATKLIVTHEAAMRRKYGAGWPTIKEAVDKLIETDRTRGITGELVALDDSTLGRWRAQAGHPRTFKDAIDHLYGIYRKPDYIVILGGPEIVPHQDLRNPLGKKDGDPRVPSDLPYACDTPASDDPATFLGPSRVVARIPDVPQESDPTLLLTLLDLATRWTPQAVAEPGYFGLSAYVWRRSTGKSLAALFGRGAKPRVSPADGPQWTSEDLGPLWHFINCHGAPVDARFYGQKSASYPPAHDATLLPTKIARGTVAAAECCYGAELYDPAAAGAHGICVTYLREGAIGFMGSTNIAYGPADSNASADLICRFFLESARDGASLGRAMLEARQRFVKRASPVSPVDLKTLAQFLLLGDASARAIQAARVSGTKGKARGVRAHATTRSALASKGAALARGVDTVRSTSDAASPKRIESQLVREAAAAGYVAKGQARTFAVRPAEDRAARSLVTRKGFQATRFHVMSAVPAAGQERARGTSRAAKRRVQAISTRMILLGREVAGRLVRIQRLYAHVAPAADLMSDSFKGLVVKKPFARGSKSERKAVMLDTGDEQLVLRRKGGNAFKDEILEELVGHRIRGNGFRTGYTLILTDWVDLKGGGKKERG